MFGWVWFSAEYKLWWWRTKYKIHVSFWGAVLDKRKSVISQHSLYFILAISMGITVAKFHGAQGRLWFTFQLLLLHKALLCLFLSPNKLISAHTQHGAFPFSGVVAGHLSSLELQHLAATCIAAISEDGLLKSGFPLALASKGLFPSPFFQFYLKSHIIHGWLSSYYHHYPWIKSIQSKHGRERMKRCMFSPLPCDESNANWKRTKDKC